MIVTSSSSDGFRHLRQNNFKIPRGRFNLGSNADPRSFCFCFVLIQCQVIDIEFFITLAHNQILIRNCTL